MDVPPPGVPGTGGSQSSFLRVSLRPYRSCDEALPVTVVEVIKAFVHDAPVGVVITDTGIDLPGPTILYANPAFAGLTGRSLGEVVGLSPRFMQGRETRRATLDAFRAALQAGKRFYG